MLLDCKLTMFIKVERKISTMFYLNLCALVLSVGQKKMPQLFCNIVLMTQRMLLNWCSDSPGESVCDLLSQECD